MPGTFLSSKERERLTRFPNNIPDWDLITSFTLTEQDHTFIKSYRRDAHRLGVTLQLCTMRYLGFCPTALDAAPMETISHLAAQLHVNPSELQDYGTRRMTRSAHFQALLDYLHFRRLQADDHDQLLAWLTERALEHDKPTLLFQMMCEHLKQQQILRPGVTVVERLVVTARSQAHHESLSRLASLLTPERLTLLDSLLVAESETGSTPLYRLRQHADTNTPAALVEALDKFRLLQQWGVDQWELSVVNPNRQKFLARIGCKYSAQALPRMGPERRYPTLVSLHQKVAETTQTHSQLLQAIGDVVLDDTVTDERLRQAIFQHIPRGTLEAAVQEARSLKQLSGHLDFLDDNDSYVRQFAPPFLSTLAFQSHQDENPVLEAVGVLRDLNSSKQRKLPEQAPIDFVPDNWRRLVLSNDPPDWRPYELCALSTLRDQLRSEDIYVPNSRRYTDPETFLIPRVTWLILRQEVCQELDLDPTGAKRLSERAQDLRELLPRVDRMLDCPDGIQMENVELIVPMDEGNDRPESAKALAEQIGCRLPRVDLTDLLLEVDQWTGFSQHLKYATGGQPRTDDLLLHLHAAVLAQGTNMGPLEMARSANLSYDRLAFASFWYLQEEALKDAVTALVNFQYRQLLAQHWGGGTLSSSDGQRFPVRGKVRNAIALPRYYGYGQGITFYTWSSDQFSQYSIKVISSPLRNATYALDAILDNETDLTIPEYTTDTAGYIDLVFALFDLLGMQYYPRLRDIGDRRLYKLKSDGAIYPRLDVRLTGRTDLTRLMEHWDDLARVAGSIKRSYVTSSLQVSRLQAYPRQGQLTKLLQEYGRFVKTLFISRYLEDDALRQRIHAQLNKGEKLHDVRKSLLFAREGVVSQKYEEGQAYLAGCLNLLTNAVVVWNMVYMQAALDALWREGYPVQEEDLVHLWPTRFVHIHRYGKYEFNVAEAQTRKGLRPLRAVA